MMIRLNRLLTAALIVIWWHGHTIGQEVEPAQKSSQDAEQEASPEPVERQPLTSVELYKEVLFGTALVVNKEDGSHGTAWVLDEEDSLLVTNHHVVEGVDEVLVYFPSQDQRTSFSPSLKFFQEDQIPLVGRVIDSRPDKDLAIIVTAAIPRWIHALPLASKDKKDKVQGGVAVKSVGNPGLSLWDNVSGEVRQVRRRKFQLGDNQKVDSVTFDVTSAINPGDSGGAVVNNLGEVIGVVSAMSRAETLRSVIIHVDEVHDYINEIRPWLQPREADHFLQRGKNYLDKDRFQLALRDFNRAIDIDDQPAVYYCSRGEAYYELGKYNLAATDLAKALQLDHELAPAYRIRGLCYLSKREYDNATDDFDKAIEIDSKHGPAFEGKALVSLAKGDRDSAIKHLGDAIRHEPNIAKYYNSRGLAHYAKATAEKDVVVASPDYYEAYRNFSEAIRVGGEISTYFANRGNVFRDVQYWKDAEQDYNSAMKISPRRPDIYRQRGLMWQRVRRFDNAIADFEKSLEYTNNNNAKAQTYVDLGNTSLLNGKDDDADKFFQMAADINPRIRNNGRLRNLKTLRTRKLYVANRTNQPIRFYVLFYTLAGKDKLSWFPGPPESDKAQDAESYLLDPGRIAQPIYSLTGNRPFPVAGQRIRIWAVGETDGKRFYQDRDEDVILVDDKNYRAPTEETYTYIFDDE
jgi:tetratricopeptide (TPR) repeat protein